MYLFQRLLDPTRLILAVFALAVAMASPVRADYLDDPEMFRAAWAKLLGAAGETDFYMVRIQPEGIGVQVLSKTGGYLNDWSVERRKGLFGTRHRLSGPVEIKQDFRVPLYFKGLFPKSELDFDQLPALFEEAQRRARLRLPGGITDVVITRSVDKAASRDETSEYGGLLWMVRVANERESAPVIFDDEGKFLGVDISRTSRGLLRDLRTQSEWPFEEALEGFLRNIGDGEIVYELSVYKDSLNLTAAAGEDGDAVDFKWDGGMVTGGSGNISAALRGVQPRTIPFRLADAQIVRLPEFLDTARAAAPEGWRVVARVETTMEPVSRGTPELVWEVKLMQPRGAMGDRVIVRVRPDNSIASLLLPESLRPTPEYLTPKGLVQAIAELRNGLGDNTKIFSVTIRNDRVTTNGLDPDDPTRLMGFQLDSRGLFSASAQPLIFETEADLFALSNLAKLNDGTVATMQRVAREAMDAPDGEVWRIKVWSGNPFWTSPDRTPFVDIRVRSAETSNHVDGYVIFTLDGQLVEAIK